MNVQILSRTLAGLSSLAIAATALAGIAPAAAAEPTEESTVATKSGGRGVAPQASAATRSTARAARVAARAATFGDPIEMPASYPYQPSLRIYPANNPDATDLNQTISHADLAPQLMDWMRTSNRISTQVVGRSTEGRDLYLVTVTAPEQEDQTAEQTAWKDEIRESPATAATDPALAAGYKTPIWITSNIHGNEWEGTDAAMQVIEDLVTSPWSEVKNTLRNHRLYFSLTLNPDGRTKATRATALSLDPNRDMITNQTPESRSFVKSAQALQPLYAADFHGYTSVLQVEPCGPPHGENYEYDLFIPHGYAISRQVEDDVVAAAIPGNTYYNTATGTVVPENTGPDTAHIKIPYRDTPDGWDDYPPIFTAQYAAYHGAVTSTVELPKGRTGSTTTPANAVINTAVAKQTMESMVDYLGAHTDDMLANQIKMFERGVAGAPKDSLTVDDVAAVEGPDEWKSLWDVVDDQDPVTLPRAYVIPVGDQQRSASDAARLVRQLIFNGITVETLDAETTVGGTTYPQGSYVVDLHQPLRGLANTLLDLGTDISQKVPSMYDISAWSYSYLWGATVDKVGLTTDAPVGATTAVTDSTPLADVPAEDGFVTFDVAGVADFGALNALLEEDATVSLLADGSAVVGPEDAALVAEVADDFDIAFEAATADDLAALSDEDTKGLEDLAIGYTGTQDDKLSLLELGFDDIVPVTSATIAADPTVLDALDVMWIGSSLTFTNAQAAGKAAVQAWVDEGHSVVGRGTNGYNAAASFGLVSATPVAGNGSGNGIVAVETPSGSVLAPYAQDSAFIYPALSFTDLGATTKVEQSYAADPLLAGHWRGTTATNGPDAAAGNASAISGEAVSGAKGFVFGTSVVYRTHTKGGLSQAARALFWAAPDGDGVDAPSNTAVTVVTDSPVTYPGTIKVDVLVTSETGTPTGAVELVNPTTDAVLATAPLVNGAATLTLAGLKAGTTTFDAVFVPDTARFESSVSEGVTVRVAKAASTTKLTTKVAKRTVTASVAVSVKGIAPVGTLVITDKGKVVRTVKLTKASAGKATVTLKLAKGKHVLKAVFTSSDSSVKSSASAARTITLK